MMRVTCPKLINNGAHKFQRALIGRARATPSDGHYPTFTVTPRFKQKGDGDLTVHVVIGPRELVSVFDRDGRRDRAMEAEHLSDPALLLADSSIRTDTPDIG